VALKNKEMTCRQDFERLEGGVTYIRKNVRPAYVKQDKKIQLATAVLQNGGLVPDFLLSMVQNSQPVAEFGLIMGKDLYCFSAFLVIFK
jgi:hypothetical protein